MRNGPVQASAFGEQINREGRYVEDLELDSIRRHEMERGSDRVIRDAENASNREQHFFRDGNAEVLRLITRGDIEEQPVGDIPEYLYLHIYFKFYILFYEKTTNVNFRNIIIMVKKF